MNEAAPAIKSLLNYSLIAVPLAFAGLPLYMHLPDFYTREFGISIGTLGILLLIIRFIDAVQDPFIGYISDKSENRRSLVIYAGIISLTLGMAGLCFGPPATRLSAAWFCAFMILATTGFSILTININMLGGFWKESSNQRVKISSWREGFGMFGLLIAALMPALLQNHFSDKISFIVLFFVFALLMVTAFIFFQRFMLDIKAKTLTDKGAAHHSFALFSILAGREKPFLFICFLSYLSASIPAVLVLFFIRDYLNAEALSGVFLALYFISGALFVGAWIKLSEKHGPYKAWSFSMILSVVAFLGAAFLSEGDSIAYGLICVLSGIALGADLALPPAILAGRIQNNANHNQKTQYYAVLAFLPKIAMALAAGLSFLALEKAGFKADSDNSEEALRALVIIYAIVPCLIKAVSAGLLWNLTKKEGHDNETIERSVNHGTTRIS